LRILLLVFLPIAAVLHYWAPTGPTWAFVTGTIAVTALAD
jgi:hypothetical protein